MLLPEQKKRGVWSQPLLPLRSRTQPKSPALPLFLNSAHALSQLFPPRILLWLPLSHPLPICYYGPQKKASVLTQHNPWLWKSPKQDIPSTLGHVSFQCKWLFLSAQVPPPQLTATHMLQTLTMVSGGFSGACQDRAESSSSAMIW